MMKRVHMWDTEVPLSAPSSSPGHGSFKSDHPGGGCLSQAVQNHLPAGRPPSQAPARGRGPSEAADLPHRRGFRGKRFFRWDSI